MQMIRCNEYYKDTKKKKKKESTLRVERALSVRPFCRTWWTPRLKNHISFLAANDEPVGGGNARNLGRTLVVVGAGGAERPRKKMLPAARRANFGKSR